MAYFALVGDLAYLGVFRSLQVGSRELSNAALFSNDARGMHKHSERTIAATLTKHQQR
jgi:hypothetical protein